MRLKYILNKHIEKYIKVELKDNNAFYFKKQTFLLVVNYKYNIHILHLTGKLKISQIPS